MHCGFAALRNACPMNLHRPRKAIALSEAVKADIARIDALWRECRRTHGKKGKFLFGALQQCGCDVRSRGDPLRHL